ncbi:uncharacterized protein LOC125953982 [Anopheles darlingi]|uniref:uncharacterized protein LOC125953982 n=1 Tax=Anopheles darlingi TaxID=43151 RepID=UPI0021005E57|nr:uncharacterized protein LOC125953982 [Anopheles darlingi]
MATPVNLRKTSDEMNLIDSLPEEVLCIVFDNLDLDSVKNASLACKRWHNIIFLSNYVGRFVFLISEKIIPLAVDMCRNTDRCYRNLRCSVLGHHDPESQSSLFQTLLQSMNNLCWLKCSVVYPFLADAIPMMPQLRSLTLGCDHYVASVEASDLSNSITSITIRSSSVEYLELLGVSKLTIDMPQLKSFRGPFSVLCNSVNSTQLENLNHLTISKEKHDREEKATLAKLAIIRKLTHLETLELPGEEENELFLAICESCIALKVLKFEEFKFSHKTVSTHLSKLTNLRQFKCFIVKNDSRDSDLELDFSSFSKLQNLFLRFSLIFLPSIESLILPKSVEILDITIDILNGEKMIQTIIDSSMQLRKLTIHIVFFKDQLTVYKLMKFLPLLKNLEVLVFCCCVFQKSDFLILDAPMDRLRELHFHNCTMYTSEFIGLNEKFPNLKYVCAHRC